MSYWIDDDDAWETVPCNFCGTLPGGLIPVSVKMNERNREIFKQGRWVFVECPLCRLRFYSPRIKQDERWMRSCMQNEASRKQAETVFKYGSFTPNDDPEKQVQFLKSFYSRYLKKCAELLGHDPVSLYEIGSNVGWLLAAARERYPAIILGGCEPNPFASEICEKHTGVKSEPALFQDAAPIGLYDLVVGWNVIEHTYTPKEDIEKAFRILKPGGVLMMRTFHEEGNEDGYQTGPIAHQYHFFQNTLLRMFEKAGFEATKEVTGRDFFVYGRKV
jgi:SAM-dependent methyltransferase